MTTRPLKRARGAHELRRTFARNLRTARELAGLSQEDIHRRTGLAQSYISQLERAVANISLDTIARLAELLDRTPVSLLRPPPSSVGSPPRPRKARATKRQSTAVHPSRVDKGRADK